MSANSASVSRPTTIVFTSVITEAPSAFDSTTTITVPITSVITPPNPSASASASGSTITVPLTSVFTPPAACLNERFTLSPAGEDSTVGSQTTSAGLTLARGITPSCYPGSFAQLAAAVTSDAPAPTVAPFYSPGVCPNHYAALILSSRGVTNFATCCPIFTVTQTDGGVITATQQYYTDGACSISSLEATILNGTQVATRSADVVLYSAITVAWKTDDVTLWAPPTTSSTAAPGPTAASSSSGLSTGAKAGIGVGVSLGALLLLALIGITLWQRRTIQRVQEEAGPAELGASERQPEELADNAVQEVGGAAAVEKSGDEKKMAAELEGEWHGWEAAGAGGGRQPSTRSRKRDTGGTTGGGGGGAEHVTRITTTEENAE